jgi:hypothetical protein
LDVTFLCCIALSIPDPIITYPIILTVKNVATHPPLSITDTHKAVVPISAPPTIRRVVVTFDVFFSRISIPKARKNKIIDDIPKLDIPKGLLSILTGKNPCLIVRSIDPFAIWISNKVIAPMASISDIWCLHSFV